MSWCEFKPVVTVADVLDSGACLGGVNAWVVKNRGVISGCAADHAEVQEIVSASRVYGDGYGNGNVYGDGYGDGKQ